MRAATLAVLFTCLSLAGAILAADKDSKDKPPAAPAGEQTKIGTLGVKATTAPAEVVAVLYTPDVDFKLLAAGDVAKKLEEFAKKVAKVKVTGTVDGDKMTVSQVVNLEQKAGDKGDGKDRKGGKGDRKKTKDGQN